MKLVSFRCDGLIQIGAVLGDEVVDLSRAFDAPMDMLALLRAGSPGMTWARQAVLASRARRPLATTRLLAPIPNPGKFLAIGTNYRSHIAEAEHAGLTYRDTGQNWFNKQVSCISGPSDPIWAPVHSSRLDYEGELAVVIGRRCRHVTASDASDYVAGYLVANDVSVRDWQLQSPTTTLGKSYDTHGPLGPWLVTSDEIDDPGALEIRTTVNGELRQCEKVSGSMHTIGSMIEFLSARTTLLPGDILSTGSPAGVGALMAPPRFLGVGDRVRVEITGLGAIENCVVLDPEAVQTHRLQRAATE